MTRYNILRFVMILVAGVMIFRLAQLQIFSDKYKHLAQGNAIRHQVQFPPRGEVYDRNGLFLAQSKDSYDLMVVPMDMEPFDTMALCNTISVSKEDLVKELTKAKKFSSRRPSTIFKQLSKQMKLRLDEQTLPGFYTQYRTIRSYPHNTAGNLLGYVGEVSRRHIEADSYYKSGDYIGLTGIERAYEEELRGRKGVKMQLVDVHGIVKGEYADGAADTLAIPGKAIVSTIDARIQLLGEELMQGKIGSIVAIEPATGEILAMVSSPTYNPDKLIGRTRSTNYISLLRDPKKPLYNRAVMAYYPPGSTFKMATGLIGLQEGVFTPETQYSCHGGFPIGRGVGCHAHASPLALEYGIQTSCNAYFCYVYKAIIENKKYGSTQKAFDSWRNHVLSMGFGRKLESDFLGELKGNIPTSSYFDKMYNKRWSYLTTVSLSIGQGEISVTPLQMANFTAILANRGHYYIPHIIKSIDGDSIDKRFYEKQYTTIDTKYFDTFVDAMYKGVNESGTGLIAKVDGLDICGKTGTAENRGADHSTFVCFAPKDNPKIAVMAYIEHGRFGASVAAPIASLVIEKYLTDTITRPALYEAMKTKTIHYPQYDK